MAGFRGILVTTGEGLLGIVLPKRLPVGNEGGKGGVVARAIGFWGSRRSKEDGPGGVIDPNCNEGAGVGAVIFLFGVESSEESGGMGWALLVIKGILKAVDGGALAVGGGVKVDSGGVLDLGIFLSSELPDSDVTGVPNWPNTGFGEAGLGFSREGGGEGAVASSSSPVSPIMGALASGELRAGRMDVLLEPIPNDTVGAGDGKRGLSLAGEEGGVVLESKSLEGGACPSNCSAVVADDGSFADFGRGVLLGELGIDVDGRKGWVMSAESSGGVDSNLDFASEVGEGLKSAGIAEGDLEGGKGTLRGSGDSALITVSWTEVSFSSKDSSCRLVSSATGESSWGPSTSCSSSKRALISS
jgi:hypothetical protein